MKRKPEAEGSPKVLLVGYNGANNTGSEARLLAIIEDIRAVLGPEALITVPTLNEANLRRYVDEGPFLQIVPIPAFFFPALRREVRKHDLVLLVEGSCYMDTWTTVLLWGFLWATRYAHALGRPCLAYAVDAGDLSWANRWLVRREASKTDLIVTRTSAAADRLRSWGVTAPLEVTADSAFTFRVEEGDEGMVGRVWPEAGQSLVGLAVVDFYLWPVVVRPWGRREHCYRWPYFFSRSRRHCLASQTLAEDHARLADRLVAEHDRSVALICMEQLDEPLARRIHQGMVHGDRARVFSSREFNASQMTVLLRSLDLLVTSRYHAGVLSLAAQVPQIAVGHDLRLEAFYQELGLWDEFFFQPSAPRTFERIEERVEGLLRDPTPVRDRLRQGYEDHVARARRNRQLLRGFVEDRGWGARS